MESFSIVIPTRNNGPYLERLLSYYQACGLKAPILIGDASDDEHTMAVRKAVEPASRYLNIDYRTYPADVEFLDKLGDLISRVRTDFGVVGADDDFFTVSGLRAAADFLTANVAFSIVHGQAVTFEVEPGPVYGTRLRTAYYVQRSIEHGDASARLVDHLSHYSTMWYSMQRTPFLAGNIEKAARLRLDATTFTELLPSCLSVIQGKAKKLGHLYMVRQAHAQKRYASRTVFDWVTAAEFPLQYSIFEDCLATELTQVDRIFVDGAKQAVKQAFWHYLGAVLNQKWQHKYGRASASSALKRRLSSWMPSLPDTWQKGTSLLGGERNQMLLPALLRSTSPYHEDFMPIYQAIGGRPAQ